MPEISVSTLTLTIESIAGEIRELQQAIDDEETVPEDFQRMEDLRDAARELERGYDKTARTILNLIPYDESVGRQGLKIDAHRSLFLSHGAPSLATSHHPANLFLRQLGKTLPKPRAAIVVSPHWMESAFAVKAVAGHQAWHDFGGFPRELYELQYSPAGDVALADRVIAGLEAAGLPTARDINPRIDHGVWVPLMLLWPEADVPIVQVAVGPGGPDGHWRLGEALGTLVDTEDDVLLIGSGSLVHNLREIGPEYAPAPDWVRAFDGWIAAHLAMGDHAALVDYRRLAPSAARAHPTEEHLLPLFVAAGAGHSSTRLHESFAHSGLSMSAYGFN